MVVDYTSHKVIYGFCLVGWGRTWALVVRTARGLLGYLSYVQPMYKSGTRPFLRRVRLQGRRLHASDMAKNTFGPVGIPLIRGASGTRQWTPHEVGKSLGEWPLEAGGNLQPTPGQIHAPGRHDRPKCNNSLASGTIRGIVFVAVSHQTGLDTRSKARRPIKGEGKVGNEPRL